MSDKTNIQGMGKIICDSACKFSPFTKLIMAHLDSCVTIANSKVIFTYNSNKRVSSTELIKTFLKAIKHDLARDTKDLILQAASLADALDLISSTGYYIDSNFIDHIRHWEPNEGIIALLELVVHDDQSNIQCIEITEHQNNHGHEPLDNVFRGIYLSSKVHVSQDIAESILSGVRLEYALTADDDAIEYELAQEFGKILGRINDHRMRMRMEERLLTPKTKNWLRYPNNILTLIDKKKQH